MFPVTLLKNFLVGRSGHFVCVWGGGGEGGVINACISVSLWLISMWLY